MDISIVSLDDSPEDFIDNQAQDYFFSSTNFARLWRAAGGKPVCLMLQSDGQTVGCMNAVEFGAGPLKTFQAMPNGCYSRLLGADKNKLDTKAVALKIGEAVISNGYRRSIITDFYGHFQSLKSFESTEYETHLVDISDKEWEPPDSKLRQQIRKAVSEGIEVVNFDLDRHIDGLMKLVKLHEKRRSVKSKYNQKFFTALAEIVKKDKRLIWKYCERDRAPVASSIFFREGDSLIHWQMYYDERFSNLQATKFIPFYVARDAAGLGMKYLNLGATPAGAEGAGSYKSKWGGKTVSYKCYTHNNVLGKIW
ncbi:MAG: GNAT family N-acetyltransferase [candidate division Zixibacteria bacterium]|nr:GNAT family N-acetyltransferase [candidate division Zixibacteria bacterium]